MDIEAYLEEFVQRDWQAAEPEDGPVRFAMVGLGWWTREQAIPATEASELCETTTVVSGSQEKAEAAGEEADAHALTYESFADGEHADAYDAVYICTPNALHLPHVETAADLGKAVLCEKPMEGSVERAREVIDVCDSAGVTLMIAYRMHTDPAVRRARELVRAGAIGEPALLHGHMAQRILELVPNPDQWRLDPELVGPGSSVMDIGIYPLNTARFVLDADPVSVTAQTSTGSEHFEDIPDERASFTVRFEGNVEGACTASQNAYLSSHLKITGTEGELTIEPSFFPWQDRELTVEIAETTADLSFPQVDQMVEEFDYFADRLLTGRDPHPDGEHGLVDMRTIEAIYESAERNATVGL